MYYAVADHDGYQKYRAVLNTIVVIRIGTALRELDVSVRDEQVLFQPIRRGNSRMLGKQTNQCYLRTFSNSGINIYLILILVL